MRHQTLVALLFLGAVATGCGQPVKQCGPANCTGCCDADGECQGGTFNAACGTSGVQCVACPNGASCQFGFCFGGGTTGGGGGGGSASGGGGGSASGGGGGAVTGGGGGAVTGGGGGAVTGGGGGAVTGGGGGAVTGGGGGAVTGGGGGSVTGGGAGGGGGTCSGCTEQGVCVGAAQMSPAACGLGGATCGTCAPGAQCVNGACQGVVETCLELSPADVDFGPAQVGCTARRTVTVTNRCGVSVSISGITASGSPFGFTTTPTLSVLTAGQSSSFELTFSPTAAGRAVGRLAVSWFRTTSATSSLGLFGVGTTTAAATETFTVPTRADMLLVIDDSCSMSDKQAAFSSNMSTFLAGAQGVDWSAAVITHDDEATTGQGRFVGAVTTVTTPNAVSTLQSRVQVGTNGSATEVGLTTAWKALTPPLITTTNTGFLRTGSSVSLVVLTDAEDQSGLTIADWVTRLQAIRGGRNRNSFTVTGFVPKQATGTCSYDVGSTGRYLGVAGALGGELQEICDFGVTAHWTTVGQQAAGRRATWFLGGRPTSATALTVRLNGSALPSTAWTYDAALNAVRLNAANAPAPGQTISFEYAAVCGT